MLDYTQPEMQLRKRASLLSEMGWILDRVVFDCDVIKT